MRLSFLLFISGIILIGVSCRGKQNFVVNDIYGEYVIDETKFSGFESYWQYDHYRFEIKKDNSFVFYSTEDSIITRTDIGTVSFPTSFGIPTLEINVSHPRCHIINDEPQIVKNGNSFDLVFHSPIYGNVFFKKGKWKPHTASDFLKLGIHLKENDTVIAHVGDYLMYQYFYPKGVYYADLSIKGDHDTTVQYRNYYCIREDRFEKFTNGKWEDGGNVIYTWETDTTGLKEIVFYNKKENDSLIANDARKNFTTKEALIQEFDSILKIVDSRERIDRNEIASDGAYKHEKLFGANWPLDYEVKKYYGCDTAMKILDSLYFYQFKDRNQKKIIEVQGMYGKQLKMDQFDVYYYCIWENAKTYYSEPFHKELHYLRLYAKVME
jgi:hypothetical protein